MPRPLPLGCHGYNTHMSRSPLISLFLVLLVAGMLYVWQRGPSGSGQSTGGPVPRAELIAAIGPVLVMADGQQTSSAALLEVPYLAVYLSASWCGPCRAFTPSLVTLMEQADPDQIQSVLVSLDRNPAAMQNYMQTYHMPFPAVPFERVRSSGLMNLFEGDGIPNLILMDHEGKIIAASFENGRYLGPEHVLAAMQTRIATP